MFLPRVRVVLVVSIAALGGCRAAPRTAPAPIRLVDLYRPALGVFVPVAAVPRPGHAPSAAWHLAPSTDGGPRSATGRPAPAWASGPGITGLAVRDGRLAGRTTAPTAVVGLRRPPSEDRDVVHEVQVRMRASAGANLSIAFRSTPQVSLKDESELATVIPWPLNSPLVPGDEMRTYVLRTAASIPAAARHLLIRPTDAAGATFEIESIRVVTRREHLDEIGTGLGWQGLSEVYRETLVARSPEVLRFDLTLPSRPRLRLAVGTVEPASLTFQVSVQDRQRSADALFAERTVTVPHRWESFDVDLAPFAGREVTLALVLSSNREGTIGLWGGPVVHQATEPASEPASDRPQGIIFIWADTLRRDHLPFHGYGRPTAPVLSRLAAGGTVFEDCVAQASWTKASGPSMMTGLYPSSHTVQSFNDVLPSSATTLAEAFRADGRATLGLLAIPFAGKFSNLHQGYEELHEPGSFDRGGPLRTKTARVAVDRLLPWLSAHRDVPFFVLLHVADPHSPFKPEPPYDTLFADPRGREEHERQAAAVQSHIKDPNMRRFGMPSREELVAAGIDPEAYVAYEKDWYDGSIRAMDTEIGRVVERLRDLGLDRRTLIVFMSDHGEEFLEHGRTFHQQSTYGELANVPLFFWGPGRVPAGKRVSETVQSIDVMPTLLELGGAGAPAGIQGMSLVPFLHGTRHPAWPRPAVTEASGRTSATAEDPHAAVGIVLDGWKLVHHSRRPPGRPEFELFERRRDPLDSSDVSARHPEIVARLTRELEAWRRRAEAMRVKPDAALAKSVSAEELERLRALGYVQ